MSRPSPPASGYFLRRALLAAAGADEHAAEGEYSPTQNARNLALGRDHRAPIARMVALHEAFHAILNGSTAFGNAMVIAGAMEAAGEPGFDTLIERMIGAALVTHETYATLASVYAVAEGVYDRSLLADYPDYLGLYDGGELSL